MVIDHMADEPKVVDGEAVVVDDACTLHAEPIVHQEGDIGRPPALPLLL